jgi:hypothetical protein
MKFCQNHWCTRQICGYPYSVTFYKQRKLSSARVQYGTYINVDPSSLTINAPLILKMRDIIFFAGKLHNGPFQGIFRGGQDFFDP